MLNQDLKKYIEENVLTGYESGSGHGLDHIEAVIKHSLEFAKQVQDINFNMCYVIAAYHDLGRKIDNETHEKISADMLRADQSLRTFFDETEIETMAEAVEDHRASLEGEPRSIYGKIVSSADRTIDVDGIIVRSGEYFISLHPDWSIDDCMAEAAKKLTAKFGENGYALQKMYFNQEKYQRICREIAEVASDPKRLKERFLKLTKTR